MPNERLNNQQFVHYSYYYCDLNSINMHLYILEHSWNGFRKVYIYSAIKNTILKGLFLCFII